VAVAIVALAALASQTGSASAKAGVKLKRIGRFQSPVYVAAAPGVRGVFVVQKGGVIRLVQGKHRRTFLDISSMVSTQDERGLLSVAFAPNYASSRQFYIYFTNNSGDIVIAELHSDSNGKHASASTLRQLLLVNHSSATNHNGGQVQIGPDGFLYAGTGDGGSENDPNDNAQNPATMLGKLLRIDPASGATTIYSSGLRNPYRFSFDLTSDPGQPRIAIGDVGQDEFEELDYTTVDAAQGANFGWDAFEGFAPYRGANSGTRDPGGTVKPIFAYSHGRGGSCTIIGGYVVRDRRLPSLYKRYVYADLCEGELRSLVPHLRRASGEHKLDLHVDTPSSFGEDTHGRVYVVSLEGPIYRLVQR
jgi:glucose/arabinose dehydrogenase